MSKHCAPTSAPSIGYVFGVVGGEKWQLQTLGRETYRLNYPALVGEVGRMRPHRQPCQILHQERRILRKRESGRNVRDIQLGRRGVLAICKLAQYQNATTSSTLDGVETETETFLIDDTGTVENTPTDSSNTGTEGASITRTAKSEAIGYANDVAGDPAIFRTAQTGGDP